MSREPGKGVWNEYTKKDMCTRDIYFNFNEQWLNEEHKALIIETNLCINNNFNKNMGSDCIFCTFWSICIQIIKNKIYYKLIILNKYLIVKKNTPTVLQTY